MSEERESYGDYSVDAEDQPGAEDMLRDDTDPEDLLDPGYAPPDHYSAGQGYGNTAWEAEHHESIDQRSEQEIPEVDPYLAAEEWQEPESDSEAGGRRAGRLIGSDQQWGDADADPQVESDMFGDDVGIDGAGASAEEAAVHILEDED